MDSESADANTQIVADAATATVDAQTSEPPTSGDAGEAPQPSIPDAPDAAPTVHAVPQSAPQQAPLTPPQQAPLTPPQSGSFAPPQQAPLTPPQPTPFAPPQQAPFAPPQPTPEPVPSSPFAPSHSASASASAPTPVYEVPPYGAETAVSKPRNILALLGLIFAIPVWPAGLVLSTLGLFKAVSRRTGKLVAVIGLVLSVATGGALIAGLAAASSAVAASTALDPGCVSVESHLTADITTLQTDAATLQSDKDSASSSNDSITTVSTDLSTIEGDLATAGGVATHDDVKTDLADMQAQVQAVGKALTAVQSHSKSSDGAAAAALTTLRSTDADLGALCAAY